MLVSVKRSSIIFNLWTGAIRCQAGCRRAQPTPSPQMNRGDSRLSRRISCSQMMWLRPYCHSSLYSRMLVAVVFRASSSPHFVSKRPCCSNSLRRKAPAACRFRAQGQHALIECPRRLTTSSSRHRCASAPRGIRPTIWPMQEAVLADYTRCMSQIVDFTN